MGRFSLADEPTMEPIGPDIVLTRKVVVLKAFFPLGKGDALRRAPSHLLGRMAARISEDWQRMITPATDRGESGRTGPDDQSRHVRGSSRFQTVCTIETTLGLKPRGSRS